MQVKDDVAELAQKVGMGHAPVLAATPLNRALDAFTKAFRLFALRQIGSIEIRWLLSLQLVSSIPLSFKDAP